MSGKLVKTSKIKKPEVGWIVRVNGQVSNVDFSSKPFKFQVKTIKSGLVFLVSPQRNMFCSVRNGDIFSGDIRITDDYEGELVEIPFIEFPVDRRSVISCFMRTLNNARESSKLFDVLSSLAGGDSNVCSYMNQLAEEYYFIRDEIMIVNLTDEIEKKKVVALLDWWYLQRNLRLLYCLGLDKTEIMNSDLTTLELYEKCKDNPYKVPVIPMHKAERIMRIFGKETTKTMIRCGEVVRRLYRYLTERNYVFTPTKYLRDEFKFLDSIEGDLIEYDVMVTPKETYFMQVNKHNNQICDFITKLRMEDPIDYDTNDDETITTTTREIAEKVLNETTEVDDRKIKVVRCKAESTIDLSPDQRKALQGALDHKICVVTGGAGVGKTTLIKQIIENLNARGVKYSLCSPIGKAVSRVNRVTGRREASTIHRLLMDNPNMTHLVIDEASTMNGSLFVKVISKFKSIKKVTMIGDANQLPPIGWGAVFEQIVRSKCVPTYVLTTNHRVAECVEDGILANANGILSSPDYRLKNAKNFTMIDTVKTGDYTILETLIKEFKGKGVKRKDLTIITPYNEYLDDINKMAQKIFKGDSEYIQDKKGKKWRVDDRVMVLENDSKSGVYNGDEGIITEVNKRKNKILVKFKGVGVLDFKVEYPTLYNSAPILEKDGERKKIAHGDETAPLERNVSKLTLSYGVSSHKSQGSEWKYIIFYIPPRARGFTREDGSSSGSSFFNKNIVYTSITRAKNYCFCIGDMEVLQNGANKKPPMKFERLSNLLDKKLVRVDHWKLQGETCEGDIYEDYYDDYF